MDERDDVVRLDYIQRKKIEMELSREEAILAQQKQTYNNKVNAKAMKIDSNQRLDKREQDLKELFDKKVLVVE